MGIGTPLPSSMGHTLLVFGWWPLEKYVVFGVFHNNIRTVAPVNSRQTSLGIIFYSEWNEMVFEEKKSTGRKIRNEFSKPLPGRTKSHRNLKEHFRIDLIALLNQK